MQIDKIEERVFYCTPYITATGFTQLMLYVLNNDLESASKYLSEKGCEALSEINDKNSIKWTALHIACRNSAKGQFSTNEMVEFLLKHGADPNVKDNYGYTPLHHASWYSNSESSLETVESLLRNGADPNAKDICGWTPLHWTSKYSNKLSSLETVEFLIRNGANPNASTIIGCTPLHLASDYSNRYSSLTTVELLLRIGADPNVSDKNGLTPLHFAYASIYSNEEAVKLLLQYNAAPINEETQILKLEIDIESFVEANKKLRQYILMLESEED